MHSAASPKKRCSWVSVDDPLLLEYHDREWGVPVHNDRKHFEVLVLSAAQAGLNWSLVLKKREGYRRAFDSFDPERVARYSEKQRRTLLADPQIIRNRLRLLLLAVRWWKAQTRSLENYATDSSDFPRIRGIEQGSQAARIQLRRANGRVCVHAGGRIGERSPCPLFSLSGTPESDCHC